MRSTKAFSLLEILTVLIIVGIAAAITLPNFTTSIEQTKAQAAKNYLLAIGAAQSRYFEDNGTYCVGVCGGSSASLNSNLLLSSTLNDPFTYTCSTPSLGDPPGTVYRCTAIDSIDTLKLIANATGVNITCAPPGPTCPS